MQKISVLMPVYNTEEIFLKEAIESILNQTYKDFEFIIINDGSTNNAEDVILSYNDERINYIKNEKNLGLIKTLNKGLNLAKGEYIARMDSDDISLPERFEKQVKFLDENPEIGVLGTWFKCFPSNRIVKTYTEHKDIKESMLVSSNNIGHPTVMIRNSVIKEFNAKYDENSLYVEDYALWLFLINKVKFGNIGEILLDYRMHKDSICKTNTIPQSLNCAKIMFMAQGKYFNLDNTILLNLIEKIQHNQKITSKELLAVNEFAEQVKIKMKEEGFNCDYEINRDFYKIAVRMCKKDLLFFKILWSKNLKTLIKLGFGFKFFNSLRFFYKIRIKNKEAISTPKISAVMALYNTPHKLLKKTIHSILNQSLSNFELIIIDDASNIEYKNFIDTLNDKRIKYFKLEKNSGPGYARNEGIKKATGEYIAIVDSDDIYNPKRFEAQAIFLDNNSGISLVSCAFKFSNKCKISPVIEKDEDIKTALLFNSALSNPAAMFRRKKFIEKNLFYPENIKFAEDYSLWIDATFKGIKMANLNEVLMIYTRRKNQLSRTKVYEQITILKDLYKKIFSKLGIEVSDEEIKLHFNIYTDNFKSMKSANAIAQWFDRIIEQNKINPIFNEQRLIDKKESSLKNFFDSQRRLFKMKIFEYNLCFYKPFEIKFEKRN